MCRDSQKTERRFSRQVGLTESGFPSAVELPADKLRAISLVGRVGSPSDGTTAPLAGRCVALERGTLRLVEVGRSLSGQSLTKVNAQPSRPRIMGV
jgi:hypothetical protein